MRRHLDALVLLALFVFLAFFVHAHTRLGAATAKPSHDAGSRAPSGLDGPPTKYDLLFGKPELALP